MTLTFELDLNILEMSKMNFLGQGFQKLEHLRRETDGRTDKQMQLETLPRCIRGW